MNNCSSQKPLLTSGFEPGTSVLKSESQSSRPTDHQFNRSMLFEMLVYFSGLFEFDLMLQYYVVWGTLNSLANYSRYISRILD
jgi:hypothetical protein